MRILKDNLFLRIFFTRHSDDSRSRSQLIPQYLRPHVHEIYAITDPRISSPLWIVQGWLHTLQHLDSALVSEGTQDAFGRWGGCLSESGSVDRRANPRFTGTFSMENALYVRSNQPPN